MLNTIMIWIIAIASIISALGAVKISTDLNTLYEAVKPIPAMHKEVRETRINMEYIKGWTNGVSARQRYQSHKKNLSNEE